MQPTHRLQQGRMQLGSSGDYLHGLPAGLPGETDAAPVGESRSSTGRQDQGNPRTRAPFIPRDHRERSVIQSCRNAGQLVRATRHREDGQASSQLLASPAPFILGESQPGSTEMGDDPDMRANAVQHHTMP